jgi:hypothetical protein
VVHFISFSFGLIAQYFDISSKLPKYKMHLFTKVLLASACIAIVIARPESKPTSSDRADIDTLELVQIMFRHGDRTPIIQYPNDPLQDEKLWHPYAEGFSSLTKLGKNMHYNLGKYFRQRYDGFLSKIYKPSEIFVQSSDADRAIMSALSNMAGLFPPTPEDPKSLWNTEIQWQPIPVHTIPKKLDNFINFGATCPRFAELKKEYIQSSPYARSINEDPENQQLFEYVSKHTGLSITDFELISDLYDTLKIQQTYNLTLPAWTKEVFPEKMGKLAPIFFDERVLVPTVEAKRVKAGPLLKFITKNMDVKRHSPDLTKEEIDQHKKAKMYVLSGHDTTSSIFLGALGVFDTQFPSYASAAIVEMHKGDPSQPETNVADHYVKVFFRNDTSVPPYEFEIPKCGYPCRLDTFKSLFADLMIDGKEWETACKSGGDKQI